MTTSLHDILNNFFAHFDDQRNRVGALILSTKDKQVLSNKWTSDLVVCRQELGLKHHKNQRDYCRLQKIQNREAKGFDKMLSLDNFLYIYVYIYLTLYSCKCFEHFVLFCYFWKCYRRLKKKKKLKSMCISDINCVPASDSMQYQHITPPTPLGYNHNHG